MLNKELDEFRNAWVSSTPVQLIKPKIPELTGVRAIAAYMVFLHHYPVFSNRSLLYYIFAEFQIGVTLFYVLSGFVIAYNYFDSAEKSISWFGRYFKNRFARIFPVYILVVLLSCQGWTPFDWFMNLTLLKGFFNDYKFMGISQSWSLTVEETFYVLAPFIFFYLRKKRFEPSTYLKLLSYFYGIAVSLLWFGRMIKWHGFFWNFVFVFHYTFFGRALEFLVGIFLARLVSRGSIKRAKNQVQGLPKYTMAGISAIALVMTVMGINFRNGHQIPLNVPWIHHLFVPASLGLFLFGLITETSILKRLLATGLFNTLGKSSYAFYLIHVGYVTSYIPAKNTFSLFIGLNVASVFIYYLYENPMNRLIRRVRVFSTPKISQEIAKDCKLLESIV